MHQTVILTIKKDSMTDSKTLQNMGRVTVFNAVVEDFPELSTHYFIRMIVYKV